MSSNIMDYVRFGFRMNDGLIGILKLPFFPRSGMITKIPEITGYRMLHVFGPGTD